MPKIEAERVDKASDDKKVVFESEEEASEESESDNEEIVVIEPEAVKKSDDVNLDDEFEKIVPFKFKRLSEESIDDVDHEIAEILSDAEPLEKEFKNDREEIDTTEQRLPVIEPESSLADSTAEKSHDEAESKPIEGETKPTPIDDAQPTETIIDEEQLPKDFDKETSEEKPPVPIPTYRWEDVKRSKEQVSGDNVCTSICSAPSQSPSLPTSVPNRSPIDFQFFSCCFLFRAATRGRICTSSR